MVDIDFDEIEDELELIVPNVYRMFIDAVNLFEYDLQRFKIYGNTGSVLKGNWDLRLGLADSHPKWESHNFHFGVGDGCGNYFFIPGEDEDINHIRLWSHDPPGIEDAGNATDYFASLLAEIKTGFSGPDRYRFQGTGS